MTPVLAMLAQAAMICVGGCSSAAAPEVTASIYECADGRWFSVRSHEGKATILYEDQHFSLPRRPSSIGVKYASPEATLIIDGKFAVFVMEADVGPERCYEVN